MRWETIRAECKESAWWHAVVMRVYVHVLTRVSKKWVQVRARVQDVDVHASVSVVVINVRESV